MKIPVRRYALFACVFVDYMEVITGPALNHADKRPNFIRWIGGLKPAETRRVNKKYEWMDEQQ